MCRSRWMFPVLVVALLLICCRSAEAQDWAKEKLDKSQRHLEWVEVKRDDRVLKCFIAYPEVKDKATTVLVIHEIFGLSDWIRKVCDDLAAEGFVAIAPDLLSGKGQDTSKYKTNDELRKAVSGLPSGQVEKDLKAVAAYALHLPAANGKVAVAGYCWGGTKTWLAATTNPDLAASFVFYGTIGDNLQNIDRLTAPVYGFYGENDARVTSTVEETEDAMEKAKKPFHFQIYGNAGHGFMRTGESPTATDADKKARAGAWSVITKALKAL